MKTNISVAMAVYQGERYIREQIDSIICQLGPDDELVISYDKSADGTLDIIKSYAQADSRVKVVYNDTPGVTGNFNNAISNCSGRYIYISDQDDKWVSTKIKSVQECFEKTGADLVIHNGVHTDENLKPNTPPFFSYYKIGYGLLRNFAIPRYSGCCMAFTEKMKDLLLPIPEIRAYDHWIGMVGECFGKIAFLDEVLIYHRIHGGNVTPPRRKLSLIIKMRAKLACCLVKLWIRKILFGKK